MLRLQVYDFDGTLINGSSPVRLSRRLTVSRMMSPSVSAKMLMWGIRYKLGQELDQSTPRAYIFESLSHLDVQEANKIMVDLYHSQIKGIIRPEALARLQAQRDGDKNGRIVLLSASFEPILWEFAHEQGITDVIGTQMEVENGHYTGSMLAPAPESEQKLIQLTAYADEHFGAGEWCIDWCYGDHFSDVPVMEAAAHPVAVDPDLRLEQIARGRGWPVVKKAADWQALV